MRTTTTIATTSKLKKETEVAVISLIVLISRPNYISVSVNSVTPATAVILILLIVS